MLTLPGRSMPVDIFYMSGPEKDYVMVAVRTVLHIHATEPEGDILVYLSCAEEIGIACLEIRKELMKDTALQEMNIVQLYPSMSLVQIQKAFEATPRKTGSRFTRKVVVTTDMAESSVAIDGIVYVVDTGVAKRKEYNPRTRLCCSMVSPISKAQASLRAHAAARKLPGKCFRLFTDKAFKELDDTAHPEMLRTEISSIVLTLKALGVEDLVHFDFVDPPAVETLMRAIENLNYIGFLDDSGALTSEGAIGATFPVEPQLAKMLLGSPKHRCSNEALSIAAMLSAGEVFFRRPKGSTAKAADEARNRFAHLDGDHLTLLNVFHAYKQQVQGGVDGPRFCSENFLNHRALGVADAAREQLKKCMEAQGLQMVSTDFQDKEYYPNIRRCIASGFFSQVGFLSRESANKEKSSGTYVTMRDKQEVALYPATCLKGKPDWVVYHELTFTSRRFLRTATQIKPEWLLDLAPKYYDLNSFPVGEVRLQLEKILAARQSTPIVA